MSARDLRFLDPADLAARQAWDEAVRNSPGATVFHTTAWMDVIAKGLGLAPRFAYLPGSRGSVRALVPLFRAGGWARPERWLNLPQSCAADPLAQNQAEAEQLLEQLASAAAGQRTAALVLRTSRELAPALPADWEARREEPLLHHVIDLAGASDIRTLARIQRRQREKFSSTQRRLESAGVNVRLARPDDVPHFARAVHRISLARHGHLAMPTRFFAALLAFLPKAARLATIGPPSGPASAFTVTLWGFGRADFLYGSGLPTPEAADAYRVCLGSEIDAAIRANLAQFDFHETGRDQHGLIVSKERWGAERVDGSYLVIARQGAGSGLRNVSSNLFALVQRLFRYVPVGVSLKLAGPVHRALQ
jgi:hypothetical protein